MLRNLITDIFISIFITFSCFSYDSLYYVQNLGNGYRCYFGWEVYNRSVDKIKCLDGDCLVLSHPCSEGFEYGLYKMYMRYSWEFKKIVTEMDLWKPDMGYQIYLLSWPAKNYIYMTGSHGTVHRSHDGGKTFDTAFVMSYTKPPNGNFLDPPIRSIHMVDSLNGIVVSEVWSSAGKGIYITTDGWKTFKTIFNPGYHVLAGPGGYCYLFDSLNFVITGFLTQPQEDGDTIYRPCIARTSDGGQTWHNFFLPKGTINKIHFLNSKVGVAVGGYFIGIGDTQVNIIYRTEDGGFTWEKVLDDVDDTTAWFVGLIDVDLYEQFGVALVKWGKIYVSIDSGKSWIFTKFRTSENPVLSVSFDRSPPEKKFYWNPINYKARARAYIATIGCSLNKNKSSTNIYSITFFDDYSNVPFSSNTSLVTIYPNPFAESVSIRFNEEVIGPIEIQIYDSMGNRVDLFRIDSPEQEVRFTPTDRAEGVYFYRIITKNKTYTGNFVKIK